MGLKLTPYPQWWEDGEALIKVKKRGLVMAILAVLGTAAATTVVTTLTANVLKSSAKSGFILALTNNDPDITLKLGPVAAIKGWPGDPADVDCPPKNVEGWTHNWSKLSGCCGAAIWHGVREDGSCQYELMTGWWKASAGFAYVYCTMDPPGTWPHGIHPRITKEIEKMMRKLEYERAAYSRDRVRDGLGSKRVSASLGFPQKGVYLCEYTVEA